MAKLTDLQRILLAHAAQHDGCALYPLPDRHKEDARVGSAIAGLTKRGFVEERETSLPAATSRIDGDTRFSLFASASGLAAIGIIETAGEQVPPSPSPASGRARTSKTQVVVELLQREGGATSSELIDATHWLPHTMRAALTGLRKKGHVIERSKRDDITCYRIVTAVAA